MRGQVTAALAASARPADVDAILTLLRAAPDPMPLAECVLAAQLRRSELADDALVAVDALDLRIEALRQTLDLARSAGLSIRGVARQLAVLHTRLAAIYLRGGNEQEAARHDRRLIAYRNWSQP